MRVSFSGDTVLIHDPFDARSGCRADTQKSRAECRRSVRRRVDGERGLVFVEPHLVFDAIAQRVRRFSTPRAGHGSRVSYRRGGASSRPAPAKAANRSEGDARQLAFEVVRELLPVRRMVQDGVDVVEDVPLGDSGVAVVRAELFEAVSVMCLADGSSRRGSRCKKGKH